MVTVSPGFLNRAGEDAVMVLDGYAVRIGARVWQVHLIGMSIFERRRWVQFALLGRPNYSVCRRWRSPLRRLTRFAPWNGGSSTQGGRTET